MAKTPAQPKGAAAPVPPALAASVVTAASQAVEGFGGVEFVHIKACFPSPLNPRKTFPEAEILELADSIATSGLLQPLTGRAYTDVLENVPNAREIYIGGRRLRALDILFENGRWPHDKMPDYCVPVIRRDCDDMELLRVALAENLNRQDMHPLEEGEALAEFRRRGASLDDVAATYGKTPRWVQGRIQVAETLDPITRKLFADGIINFEAARELVRLPEEVRSGHVAAIRMGDKGYRTAADIRDRINDGLPRVKDALFNPKLYTGERMNGPEVQNQERFADVALFRQLQGAAIEERIKALESKWAFVEVFREKKRPAHYSEWSFLQDHKLDKLYSRADKKKDGAAIIVFPDLTIEVIEGVCKGKAPPAPPTPTKADLKAAGDAVAGVSNGRRTYAHQRKSGALQLAILRTGRRAATEMVVMALLGDGSTIGVRAEQKGPDNRYMAADIASQLHRWHSEVFDARAFEAYKPGEKGASAYVEFSSTWSSTDRSERRLAVYEQIGGLTDEELDELFTLLVAARCGSFAEYHGDGVQLGNSDLTVAVATRYGVNMARDWQIDDAYLGTMSRDQLHALATKINLWCNLRDLPELDYGDLQKMKVGEMRQTLAEHVRANGVRLVPPELKFESSKMVQANLRSFGEGGKVSREQVQTDILDMIDKAADVADPPEDEREPVVLCGVDLPISLHMRLERLLFQVDEGTATSITLRLPSGEFATLHRYQDGTLEIASHFAADACTYVGGSMVPKKLIAFLRTWLDVAEADITAATKAKFIQFHHAPGAAPAQGVTMPTRVICTGNVLDPNLLLEVATALQYHGDFGHQEIYISGPDPDSQRLLLDRAAATNDYYIIGFEGAFGDKTNGQQIEETLRAWLASVPEPDDDAIDTLFDEGREEVAA